MNNGVYESVSLHGQFTALTVMHWVSRTVNYVHVAEMALFRQNLNSGMNFLRRHFSSDDLYREERDDNDDGHTHRMNLPGDDAAVKITFRETLFDTKKTNSIAESPSFRWKYSRLTHVLSSRC